MLSIIHKKKRKTLKEMLNKIKKSLNSVNLFYILDKLYFIKKKKKRSTYIIFRRVMFNRVNLYLILHSIMYMIC